MLFIACSLIVFSCVSPKQLKQAQAKNEELNASYLDLQNKYRGLQGDLAGAQGQNTDLTKQLAAQKAASDAKIADLNGQIDFLKQNNTTVLSQLKDLSVISGSQAESIKKSLENIGAKDMYIKDLQSSNGVLGKVAKVLNNQPDIEFLVEGHTDSVAFKNGILIDNWDLSVKRATTVVRLLQEQYGLDPKRMSAAGRGQYLPVADNSTAEGRAANRRTRIVILPQLDQFFKLLEKK